MKEKTAPTKMDHDLMMESSDLSKNDYNLICVRPVYKDIIKVPLIDVLTHYISPIELYKKIQSCSMLITGKNKLSPDQLKCCFLQPPLLPDYKTFDFDLLYKLIKHLCSISRPTQGWGIEPRCYDIKISDDIERLRQFRDNMYICPPQVFDGKSEEFLNSVGYVFQRFHNLTKNRSNYNYKQELKKIALEKLEYKYPKKEKQLENELSDKIDEPVISKHGAEEAKIGSTIQFNVDIKSAKNPEWSVNCQKNKTGATEPIDICQKKYDGSNSRQLVIKCVSKEDEGKYQAFLSRESNEPPCFDFLDITTERGITIKYKVVECSPQLHEITWMKNGEILGLKKKKYVGGGLKDGFITITSPTIADRGTYLCTVTNAVGSVSKSVKLGLPKILIERCENPNGSQCFIAKIKSIPAAYHVQWKVKKNGHEDFSLIDVNDPEYYGTSNSLHCPVLVVNKKELLENQCFHIKVDNFIGSSIKEIFGTPIQYFFYKPDQDFNHFHYVYNLIRNCKSRVENIHLIKEQKNNLMPKDVLIKIGIAGNFHEDNLHLISGGTWKETISEDQQIWESSPLLCFQNDLPLKSVLKIAGKVSARHRIIITSDATCKEAEKTADSIIIVGKNKQQIKKIITICLEEPFDQILKRWLENFRNQALTKVASEIIAEILEIRKHLDFEKSKLTTGISGLLGGGIEFIVPDNVKVFLFRMPYVNSFGIWENSSFKVFVQKETDKNKIKEELLNINKDFFNNFHLEIVKGKFVQKKTLKQGDPLLSCKQNDSELYNSGTLGGFVRTNDKRKIYALTCNHIFPKEKQLAYANDSNGFRKMGTCVFTTKEKACDFAAIELEDSFSDICDVTVRRDDNKKVNAKLYTKDLRNVGLVHKIGAATNVTSGRIISLEYYDKEMDSHCRENIFLVKGLNGPFSKEGDSGSLVFSRPNSVIQNSVNVLGMVYAQNSTIDYDDDDFDDPHRISAAYNDAENVSVCYRIHTALELFKKSQGEGFDVKFQDDLSVTLSSSLQSLRSEDSTDILK